MRQGFWLAALVAASVMIAPAAFAWEIQHTGTNPDGTPRFADPDATTDAMAEHLAGGGNSGGSMIFGNTTLSIGGGSGNNYSISPALQQQFFGNPAVSRTVPSSNW